jgi:hypothetical protein
LALIVGLARLVAHGVGENNILLAGAEFVDELI